MLGSLHTHKTWDMSDFLSSHFEYFPGTYSFFAGSGSVPIVFARIGIKVRPGSGTLKTTLVHWLP